ncbi:hypothetical protein BJY00DRAFT_275711 [Aspergillus carlsbadensis]|nr:hypothetical protein BJY00DRAFT_275711 [Aspergillus carlsbadensis]
MEQVSPQNESLAAVGKEVIRGFAGLVTLVDEEYQPKLSNEMQRLDLWASSLGLYHTGHSSLDYRFRDSPTLFQYTLGLLNDLLETIQIVAQLAQEGSEPGDEGEMAGSNDDSDDEEDLSSYPSEDIIKEYFCNITITVDRLFALSFKVRNPAVRTGLSRTITYKQLDNEAQRVIDGFKWWDLEHTIDLFRSWRRVTEREDLENHFLVRRLALANTHRRQQFKYWQRRRAKYESYHREVLTQLAPLEKEGPITAGPSEHGLLSEPTTATALGPTIVAEFDKESIMSRESYNLKGDETEETNLLPPPPDIDPDKKEFECPYCYILCNRKTLQPRAWERHVIRDLRPYVCTFDACKEPYQQYDTRPEWIAHELTKHGCHPETPRKCPLCLDEKVSPGHIASHLQRIASFALPRLHDDSEAAVGGVDSRADAGDSSGREGSAATSFDDPWAESEKTVRLILEGHGEVNVRVKRMDHTERYLATSLIGLFDLDMDTELKLTAENGIEIPMDYDSLYNEMTILARPLDRPTFVPGASEQEQEVHESKGPSRDEVDLDTLIDPRLIQPMSALGPGGRWVARAGHDDQTHIDSDLEDYISTPVSSPSIISGNDRMVPEDSASQFQNEDDDADEADVPGEIEKADEFDETNETKGTDQAGHRELTGQTPVTGHIRTETAHPYLFSTQGELDPRYKVQYPDFFTPGKVFSILWHEDDARDSKGSHVSFGPLFRGKHGQAIYSTIRRMVVLKSFEQYSWCFAISTYGGRGLAKPGLDPYKHAVMHMSGTPPRLGSNEPITIKEPLEVECERFDESLHSKSRLNFGKIYTVEHNVKVLPIGEISEASMPKFLEYAREELAI